MDAEPESTACRQGIIRKEWCHGAMIVELSKPGGIDWTDSRWSPKQEYENIALVGIVPEEFRRENEVVYFTYEEVEDPSYLGICKIGGAPKKVFRLIDIHDHRCPTDEK
ncbi:hypothetical protein GCM10027275_07520 [Rhabdobacter roseus]